MLRKLKQNFLQDPIVLAAPLATKLDKRPVTVTILAPDQFQLDIVQKAALGLLLIPFGFGFLVSIFDTNWTLAGISGFILLVLALIVWIIKIRAEMMWRATWHTDAVEVEDSRYGPLKKQTIPLTEYKGLRRDYGLIGTSRYGSGKRIHGLILEHSESDWSILLYASRQPISDETVAYYQLALNKPVLE